MGTIASPITSLTIVYSTVYSDADQSKHQSSALLAFARGIHRGPVNFPHKWPVTRKVFPFDDVIMDVTWASWRLNRQHFSCLFNSLFRLTVKETSKPRITGLFPPVISRFLHKGAVIRKHFHTMSSSWQRHIHYFKSVMYFLLISQQDISLLDIENWCCFQNIYHLIIWLPE